MFRGTIAAFLLVVIASILVYKETERKKEEALLAQETMHFLEGVTYCVHPVRCVVAVDGENSELSVRVWMAMLVDQRIEQYEYPTVISDKSPLFTAAERQSCSRNEYCSLELVEDADTGLLHLVLTFGHDETEHFLLSRTYFGPDMGYDTLTRIDPPQP